MVRWRLPSASRRTQPAADSRWYAPSLARLTTPELLQIARQRRLRDVEALGVQPLPQHLLAGDALTLDDVENDAVSGTLHVYADVCSLAPRCSTEQQQNIFTCTRTVALLHNGRSFCITIHMTEGQQQRIGVGVVGATGYGGQELVRLLARHPGRRPEGRARARANRTSRGRCPGLARIWDGEITAYSPDALAGCDVVFLSTPEAFAATSAAELLARGHRVIDLSGAFRLKDPALRARFYPATPDPLPDGTLYGLPEFDAAARARRRGSISCPGCYPTAAMLSLLPLTRAGLLQGDVIVDAKSGISGAGKGASERTHFSENHGSVAAYALFGHRHTPEMEQALGLPVTFTPHLVPLDRGILSTTYARLKPGVDGGAGRRRAARRRTPMRSSCG